MKIAVLKLGARISYSGRDTAGGNAESRYIIDMLHRGGAEIDIYTKILAKDKNPSHLTFRQIADDYQDVNNRGYNALVVLNGTVNFFGGAEIPEQILNYNMINKFKGKVYYIYCDPALPLRQVWGAIEPKTWAENWKKEDIFIERKDIIYVSQPYELNSVWEIISKTKVPIDKVIHFPFEKFVCLDEKVPLNENPPVDLSYGGTMRGNRRIDKMVKFYYGYSPEIKVEMFGKMKPDDLNKVALKRGGNLREPNFSKPVDFSQYMEKINDTMSHIVIGDKWYEGRDMPQRCYQSIWGSVVTFIDIELDPVMRVFGSSDICKKFNYVSSAEDVEKRIAALKANPEIRKQIVEEQIKCVNFDPDQYCKDFYDIIADNAGDSIQDGTPSKPDIKVIGVFG